MGKTSLLLETSRQLGDRVVFAILDVFDHVPVTAEVISRIIDVVGYDARNRTAISCAPAPLAMYTARRFDVSWASQSNAPPSMSGT